VILTDGRVADTDGAVRRAAARLGCAADAAHVIDIEDGPVRLGLAAAVADAAGARLHALTGTPAMPRTAA
jgi:Mg-chelatase subunit ChlD